jgi:transcriptional regulator with PAS, ATPase and Fis domain
MITFLAIYKNFFTFCRMRTLIAWLGNADLKAAEDGAGLSGPIGQAVHAESYDKTVLLTNQLHSNVEHYVDWLTKNGGPACDIISVSLTSPTNFREIYAAASAALGDLIKAGAKLADLTIHISPGTPAMQAVWIILARTKYPTRLIESSREQGVREADIPFEISAEFIPEIVRAADKKRREASGERPPENVSFGDIIYRSAEMERTVADASRYALRNLPVLIEGESGTGKELLARAIHNNSPRAEKPFIVVNCGAIPAELVESEFFGHKKGAFTGAIENRTGAFDAADGGTLFLDEIGELPMPAQVTLLRALQESEVKPIGSAKAHKVDVRIIAATNRGLISEVAEGKFREDLYYRLAVATLDLPALRRREGDLGYLADRLLQQVNVDAADEPGYVRKKFSPSARNLILSHSWPGNVRELLNTIRRVTLFTDGDTISGEDMARAIRPIAKNSSESEGILHASLDEPFDINEKIKIVACHYLSRAMEKTGNNKRKAAKLLGFANPQTLTNWLEKYEVR